MTTDNTIAEAVPDEPTTMLCHYCDEGVEMIWDFVHPRSQRFHAHRTYVSTMNDQRRGDIPFMQAVDSLITSDIAMVLCDSCLDEHTRCVQCTTLVGNNDIREFGYDYYCSECYYDYIYECDDCGNLYHSDNGCDNDHSLDDDDDDYAGIHSYSYRPAPLFYINISEVALREPRRVSVTGFELETEAMGCDIYDAASKAKQLFGGTCYLKHDGSLSNGFEIVSHPMTREYIDKVFPFDAVKTLANMGMRSAQTQTCGLHVHINKGFFKGRETSFYRFLSMFHNNGEQWRRVAGRSNSSYARWGNDEEKRMLVYTKGLNRGHDYNSINNDRYVAINLQPSQTIELRFFKGTLRPETLKARIEAVHAVAEYSVATRNNVNIKASNDWDKFREFALANNYLAFSEYAELKGV